MTGAKTMENFVSIVIPTFNEAENIRELVPLIEKALADKPYGHEILVVDDDSPDNTWEVAGRMSSKYPLRVIRRKREKGLASAVLRGFKESRGNILGVMDADLCHPPEAIAPLVDEIIENGRDMAIGSRLTEGGRVEDWPVHRRLTSFSGRILARPLTPVKDIMSGFFFLRRKAIEGARLTPRGYKIGLEILVKGSAANIIEHPIVFKNRYRGKSKLNFKIHFEYMVQLADLYVYKFLRKKHAGDPGKPNAKP